MLRRPVLTFVLGLGLGAPLALFAAQVTSLTPFANGQVADATQVNANFDALRDAVNDVDATQLATDAASLAKVSGGMATAGATGVGIAGTLKVGSGTTCTAAEEGAIRYGAVLKALEFCDGTGWRGMSSGARASWRRTFVTGLVTEGPLGAGTSFLSSLFANKGYSSVVLDAQLTGDFDIVATWGTNHIGFGLVYGAGVKPSDVNGYSNDPAGAYFGALATTGFPSGYSGTFAGKYPTNGASSSVMAMRWSRVGTAVKAEYNLAGSTTGPWTLGGSATVAAGVPVVIGCGEAGSAETAPLTLVSATF